MRMTSFVCDRARTHHRRHLFIHATTLLIIVLAVPLNKAFSVSPAHHDLIRIQRAPHMKLIVDMQSKKGCRFGHSHCGLRAQPEDDGLSSKEATSTPPTVLTLSMIFLPVISLIFPNLLHLAKSLLPNSAAQFSAVTALFVSNRVYLYVMASTIVGLAGSRGSADNPQLGRRITDLTEELLYRPRLGKPRDLMDPTFEDDVVKKPTLIQSLVDSGIEENLDQVSTESQALILPLLVSFLLALSIFLLPFWSGTQAILTGGGGEASALQEALSEVFPAVSRIWNTGLLALFTRSEVRRLGYQMKWIPDSVVFEWTVAITITGLACFWQVWQAQNFVNMALAILVARAIQLNSFVAVVGALSLLTIYDASSVFLIPAAGASAGLLENGEAFTSTSLSLASQSTAAGSAMRSVAVQKLTSETFSPGLLTTKIGNSLGGALGLGDAVFPSIMSTYAKRFDEATGDKNDEKKTSFFAVSMVGYMLGCIACEFAPLISTSGLPALVFIIPSMVGSVLLAGVVSGQLDDLVAFDPKKKN